MSYVLKRADLARIRDDLEVRRTETLRRHAAELSAFEAEQGELETLRQMAASFAAKYQKGQAAVANAASQSTDTAHMIATPNRQRPDPGPWQVARRSRHLSNFDMFARTMAQSDC